MSDENFERLIARLQARRKEKEAARVHSHKG
jgi:hypothetical protein